MEFLAMTDNNVTANSAVDNQETVEMKLGWYRKATSATFITLFIPIIGIWIFWTGTYAGPKDDPKLLNPKSKYLALMWGLILATHLTSPSAKVISGVAATAFAMIGIGLVLINRTFNWKEKVLLMIAGGLAIAMFNASVGKQQDIAATLRQSSFGEEADKAFVDVMNIRNLKGDKADKLRVVIVNEVLMCSSAYLSKNLDKKALESALNTLDSNRSTVVIEGYKSCLLSLETRIASKLDNFHQ